MGVVCKSIRPGLLRCMRPDLDTDTAPPVMGADRGEPGSIRPSSGFPGRSGSQ